MTLRFAATLSMLGLALGATGCTVGEGAGAVSGSLFIIGCAGLENPGTPDMPSLFNLKPKFFAAEPLLDIGASGGTANRLIIRIQANGRRREANDVLKFDIPNSGEVARCVHDAVTPPDPSAGMDGGADDVDGGAAPGSPTRNLNCYRGPNGVRLRVGPDALVRSYFTPNATCPCQSKSQPCSTQVVGTALSTKRADGDWESWIEFAEFGGAGNPSAIIKDDFKVDYDQRIHATAFSLTIEDDVAYQAMRMGQPVLPSRIGGTLAGWFDFEMQRGQGAQTFP